MFSMQLNGAARWVWKLECRQDDGLKLFLFYFYDDYKHYHTTEKDLFVLMTSSIFYSACVLLTPIEQI